MGGPHTVPPRGQSVWRRRREAAGRGSASPGFAARASSRSRRPISSPNSTWSLIKTPPKHNGHRVVFVSRFPGPPLPLRPAACLHYRADKARPKAPAPPWPPPPSVLARPLGSSTPASPRSLSSRPRGQGAAARGPRRHGALICPPPPAFSFNDLFAGAQVSAEPKILFFYYFSKRKDNISR